MPSRKPKLSLPGFKPSPDLDEHQELPGRRAAPGFSRRKRQPGSEIFTKFADVKSRIVWTAERRQQLQKMWTRGDKAAVIAVALDCKVGAVNVARARFGLPPRRIVSGRPKEPDEPAHRIERVAFTTSRLMEFCTEKELVAQTGHESYEWPRVITKELVDNGIDACEEAEVSPSIKVTIKTGNAKSRRRPAKPTRVVIEDNGPGIPPETIAGIIDYNVRVSSREAYISPTRGRQGNALKSILPMAYLLGGEGKGETWIEARGIKHRILFSVNQIKQEPIIGHTTTRSKVTTGTRITVFWPAKATVEYQDEDDYTREGEATFQTDAIKDDLAKALNENKLLLSELHRLGVGAPTDDLVRINSVRALKTLLQSCPWNTREFESPPHFLSPGERKNFADLAQSWGQTILNQVAQRVPTEQPKTTTEAA